MNIPDPIIQYVSKDIYSPSDDSYLIIDYFRDRVTSESFDGLDLDSITNIVDIGTGSGIIAIFFELIHSSIKKFNPHILASDISSEALRCARLNALLNNKETKIQFVQSNLFKSFPNHYEKSFEIILFNPPYLPSIKSINQPVKRDLSWNGGSTGLEIISNFLEAAKDFINSKVKGLLYFISSSLTNDDLLNKLVSNSRFKREIVKEVHIFFESIFLNRLTLG